MPEVAASVIARWVIEKRVRFIIKPPRVTKLGDFRPAHGNRLAQITVNGDLNPYNFLVTTVHEFAHLECYEKYGNKVSPHGQEWKDFYTEMMRPFIDMGAFPDVLVPALHHHITNPSASSCNCPVLTRALAAYDENPRIFLSDLAFGENFVLHRTVYTKLSKRRTRYLCRRVYDAREFVISAHAPVERWQES